MAIPELACAVPFYGRQPPLKEVDKIKAPLLLHYAGLDSGINEGWPAYEQALKEHHKVYEAYFYQGVNHGFHNDSTPRYDRAAADLAGNARWHGLRSIYASATVINSATARSKTLYNLLYNDWEGAMENHFGKGLMAGLQASYADTAAHAANFAPTINAGLCSATRTACLKNRRPPAQRLGSGDPHPSLWPDRDMVMDFFKEGGSGMAMRYFLAGYRLES